ncbi:MAG TPA: MFS transporter [Actinomycetota bacterium]|nr:MFS transporter [Actinomycetota bacterium]
MAEPSQVRYATTTGRWVLAAAVGGSSIAFLDATVVNIALPRLGEDLDMGFSGLQWVSNGYLVTLSALILLGGALGDLYGRRRVFVIGTAWFAVASLLCGLAPNGPSLVAARALQGIGGALLTPASLAIIQSSFEPDDRGRAIGAWSGLGGVTAAIGPFLGGWLVDAVSWRAIFLINLPLAAAVMFIAQRHVPETRDESRVGWHPDLAGGVSAAVGLAGLTYVLIEVRGRGWESTTIRAAAIASAVGFATFLLIEWRERHPMLPLAIFGSRTFTGSNLATFAIYGALGGFFFLFAVTLQSALGYSPLEAGAAGLPVTLIMLVHSARAGRMATHTGPRIPMTLGPFVMAAGLLLARRIAPGGDYLTDVLPAVIVFAIGLVHTVAPLTTTVLAAADPEHAGVASGVNNAVARAAGLVAVAVLPVVAGLGGDTTPGARALTAGFSTAVTIAAAAVAAGGLISLLTVPTKMPAAAPALESEHHCAVGGPPMRPAGARWGCPDAA